MQKRTKCKCLGGLESSVAVCNVLQGFRRDRVPQLKDSGETESLNFGET